MIIVDDLFPVAIIEPFISFFRHPTRSAVQKVIDEWIIRISLVIKLINVLEFGRFF